MEPLPIGKVTLLNAVSDRLLFNEQVRVYSPAEMVVVPGHLPEQLLLNTDNSTAIQGIRIDIGMLIIYYDRK